MEDPADDDFGISHLLRESDSDPEPATVEGEPGVDVGPLDIQFSSQHGEGGLDDGCLNDEAFEAQLVASLGVAAARPSPPTAHDSPPTLWDEFETHVPLPPEDSLEEDPSLEAANDSWAPTPLPPLVDEVEDETPDWLGFGELSAAPSESHASSFSVKWMEPGLSAGAATIVGQQVVVAHGTQLHWLPRRRGGVGPELSTELTAKASGLGTLVALAPGPSGSVVGLSTLGRFLTMAPNQAADESTALNQLVGECYGARLLSERPLQLDPSYAVLMPGGQVHAFGPRKLWPKALASVRQGQSVDTDGVNVAMQDSQGKIWGAEGGRGLRMFSGRFPSGVVHVSGDGGAPLVWFAHWTAQPSLRVLRFDWVRGAATLLADVRHARLDDAQEPDLSTLLWDPDYRSLWVGGEFGLLRLDE